MSKVRTKYVNRLYRRYPVEGSQFDYVKKEVLKRMCRDLGLKTDGSRTDYIQRLVKYLVIYDCDICDEESLPGDLIRDTENRCPFCKSTSLKTDYVEYDKEKEGVPKELMKRFFDEIDGIRPPRSYNF